MNMGTGYELAKCLDGTLWEPDFLDVCAIVLMDEQEFGPMVGPNVEELERWLGVE